MSSPRAASSARLPAMNASRISWIWSWNQPGMGSPAPSATGSTASSVGSVTRRAYAASVRIELRDVEVVRSWPAQEHHERSAALELDATREHVDGDVECSSVGAGEGRPAVPQHQDALVVTGPYVAQGVAERVEVVAEPLGKAEGGLAGEQELPLVLDVPGVEPDEAPVGVLGTVLDPARIAGRRPVVDPDRHPPREYPGQPAHGSILENDA